MHYSLLVPAQDKKQLAKTMKPYKEYDGEEWMKPYIEFDVKHKSDEFQKDAEAITAKDFVQTDPERKAEYERCLANGEFTAILESWGGGILNPETGEWGHWHNPNGYWDWYQVGGRWTGLLSAGEYNPNEDPRNREICDQCHGRADPDCQRCKGKGTVPVWPTARVQMDIDSPLAGEVDWDAIKENERSRARERHAALHIIKNKLRENVITHSQYQKELWDAGLIMLSTKDPIHTATIEEYVEYSGNKGLTYGFVDSEGQWHTKEKWNREEWVECPGYSELFWEWVESLPANQRIFVVDYHN